MFKKRVSVQLLQRAVVACMLVWLQQQHHQWHCAYHVWVTLLGTLYAQLLTQGDAVSQDVKHAVGVADCRNCPRSLVAVLASGRAHLQVQNMPDYCCVALTRLLPWINTVCLQHK